MNWKERYTMSFFGWKFFPLDDRKMLNRKAVQQMINDENFKGLTDYIEGLYDLYERKEVKELIDDLEARRSEERKQWIEWLGWMLDTWLRWGRSRAQIKAELKTYASIIQHYDIKTEINNLYKEKILNH